MRSIKFFFVLVLVTSLGVMQSKAQRTSLSTVNNFSISAGRYSFDIYATRTSTSNILVGTTNFIVNTNRQGLSPVGMTMTNSNPGFTGPSDHSGDYDPMRVDTIVGVANAGKIAVTIFFTGNNTGAGSPLTDLPAPGIRICTITMPIINTALTAQLTWDQLNSAIIDSRSQAVVNSFVGSDNSPLGTSDVKEQAPIVFALNQNYPNPFNPSTEIRFSVAATARATLDVYNLLGQKVVSLFDDVAEAGRYYRVKFTGNGLASGMYLYRLQSGKKSDLKKLLLLK